MQYGKIENNNLIIFDGKSVRINGRVYVNPTDEQKKTTGWKPIIEDAMPEPQEGYYVERKLTQGKSNIHIRYELMPIPEEVTEEMDNDTGSDNGL